MGNIKSLLDMQKKFGDNFYNEKNMSDEQKQEMLKTICLSMHNDVSSLANSTNFKYYSSKIKTDETKLLYSTIDVFRYILATWNLFEISPEEINNAFIYRDIQLNESYKEIEYSKSNCEKVVVVDIDDVLCEFRKCFNQWLRDTYQVNVSDNSKSYYSSVEVKEAGYSPEIVFHEFIKQNKLVDISPITNMINFVNSLYEKGYYVQLLTSRPSENHRCHTQTYAWLKSNNVKYHSLAFSPEKYLWLSQQDYYIDNKVLFAIDDSGKHAIEYASHGIVCIMPDLSYNKNARHDNIFTFDRYDEKSVNEIFSCLILKDCQ